MNEYFEAVLSSTTQPNQCSLQHKQAINQQVCSCRDERCPAHSFAGIVSPVCMSEIARGKLLTYVLFEHN